MTDPLTLQDLPLAALEQHIAALPVDKNRIKGLTTSNYITGQVTSAGGVTAGSGFSVNRSATGTYDLTWTTAFSATPTVLVSLYPTGSSILRQIRVNSASTSGAQVFIATTVADSGAGANEPFAFVAFATI